MTFLLFLLSPLLTLSRAANYTISSAREFKTFSDDVTNGKSFHGTTVLLTADLDLSPVTPFPPIGQDASKYFDGDFDGQGHVISNLHIETSTQYAALFGYSGGVTIQRLVLDASCTVASDADASSHNSYESYYASILGVCEPTERNCALSDIVNMATVTFTGVAQRHLWIGGIAAVFFDASNSMKRYINSKLNNNVGKNNDFSNIKGKSQFYTKREIPTENYAVIKNCINYGAVNNSGKSYVNKYVSGIIGEFYGGYISNCANYGTVTNIDSNSPEKLLVSGIVAASRNALIENCVSAGKINSPDAEKIGAIIGGTWSTYSEITHSYWTVDTGYTSAYGRNESSKTVIEKDSRLAKSLDITRMAELNNFAENKDNNTWSKWIMLHLNGGYVCDVINQDTVIVIHKYIPNPAKIGSVFKRWCLTENCKNGDADVYNPSEIEYDDVTDVYATFDDVTYSIVFDLGNGTFLEKEYLFGDEIEYPILENRKGYKFSGWSMTSKKMPADNVTATALWNESTTFVELTFSPFSATFSKKDVENVVKMYMGDDDVINILLVKNDEVNNKNVAVIEFENRDKAEGFVNKIESLPSGEWPKNLAGVEYTVKPEEKSFAVNKVNLLSLLTFIL